MPGSMLGDDILSPMKFGTSAEVPRDPAASQELFEQIGCTATNCFLAEANQTDRSWQRGV